MTAVAPGAAEDSDALFRAVVEAALDAIVVIEGDGRVRSVNAATERIFGYGAAELVGRNVRTGVDNAFVAPVTIGDDAWIAAGSVITEDVPPGALAIARAKQVNKEGRGGKRND